MGKGPDYKPIMLADPMALKGNPPLLLAASPSRVITVLASSLKMLISIDFPEKWPNLLDGAKVLLATNSIREVGTGTAVVLEMVCAFWCVLSSPLPSSPVFCVHPRLLTDPRPGGLRFRQKSDILTAVIVQTFAVLECLLQTCSTPSLLAPTEQEIPAIFHSLFKTY